MDIDYYAILNVPRDAHAKAWEVILSYRNLALRLYARIKAYQQHPSSRPEPEEVFDLSLLDLNEKAYCELLNEACDLRGEIFNNYGEKTLKSGVPARNGFISTYCYHKDYMRTYHELFASYSPYADLIDDAANPPNLQSVNQGKEIIKFLPLTLEEIYKGCIKSYKIIKKKDCNDFENKSNMKESFLFIPIEPGCLEGTCIKIIEAGDECVTKKPIDIVFITSDIPHDKYRREKFDLHMDYTISLKMALSGFKISITTLDDRKLEISITETVE